MPAPQLLVRHSSLPHPTACRPAHTALAVSFSVCGLRELHRWRDVSPVRRLTASSQTCTLEPAVRLQREGADLVGGRVGAVVRAVHVGAAVAAAVATRHVRECAAGVQNQRVVLRGRAQLDIDVEVPARMSRHSPISTGLAAVHQTLSVRQRKAAVGW